MYTNSLILYPSEYGNVINISEIGITDFIRQRRLYTFEDSLPTASQRWKDVEFQITN